jgi:hypothetical protein
MHEFDDLDTIRSSRLAQSQVLNKHFVISSLDQPFGLFYLTRCIYLESVLREIFPHGKTDRFLVVYHKQIPHACFNMISLCPATQ